MKSNKSATVAICAFVIAAVMVFLAIVCVNEFLPIDYHTKAQPDYGMQFNSMDVEIKWRNDRTCRITQDIEAQFLTGGSHGIYVDIPVNSGEKVRGLSVRTSPYRPYRLTRENGGTIIRAVIGSDDKTFGTKDVLRCVLTYDYMTPEHPRDKNVLALNAIGGGWSCLTKKATVTVEYPAAPNIATDDLGIRIGADKITAESSGTPKSSGVSVVWSDGNKKVKIEIKDRLQLSTRYKPLPEAYALKAFEKVEIAYRMPENALVSRFDGEFLVTLCTGLALVAFALIVKLLFAKNKRLSPIVGYYPPRIRCADGKTRRMLPVQMGKIIDGGCSSADVTSLIFYWASKGNLSIDEREDDTYLTKENELDAVAPYEREMYDKLFSFGDVNEIGKIEVGVGMLKGKFAPAVAAVKSSVDKEYRGKLYKTRSLALCVSTAVLAAIFGSCISVFTSLRAGKLFFAAGGIASAVAAFVSVGVGAAIVTYYHKLSGKKRHAIIAAYIAACIVSFATLALIMPDDIMSIVEKTVFAICMGLACCIAPFIIVRTPFYDERLNEILGFRDFLRDAEKDKLETMIEECPQYYYEILPYANVLGVSDIWADKFKSLSVEPPDYYRNTGPTLFDIVLLSNLTRSVGNSLTYRPPSSSGGSLSGGSGGGFSGGSFGGGGGGRW